MERELHALLVEDSEEDAELVELALKRGGFNVVAQRVENRTAMDEALNHGPWDVIVADYSMPQFTLREALDIVRNKGMDIPFLIVSATIVEDAAIQAGLARFRGLPVAVGHVLDDVLEPHQLVRAAQ